ncbi:class II aldolase/adducin family protein [Herbiconiux ginsengi]|uniref:L-fuculose-phosphate aldolase n=1 Tax=Herbiconiux ginsengi TaxID=381665 RepID=A0A1H3MSE9_9MICO|nr:class II aldolase/adducin family protein [Herbiconiux ginsengi]SDY79085.1 L-fuculose-phosphate aldolase [Herbiconiux ginsengi]
MTDDLRSSVVLGSRVLAENGHSDMVWGHLSLRDPAGRGIWIKRAGLGFEELTSDDIHLVGWDGERVEGGGDVHLECHIHLEVMRARADVSSVVHSHPEAAVTLAGTGIPLLAVGHEACFFAPGDLPRFTETGDLIRDPALGRSVAATLGERNAALLVDHGIVVAESSLPRAVFGAVLLERAARMTLAAVSAAGGVGNVAHSSQAEALAKRDRCYSDRQVGHGWDYLVRRLRTDTERKGTSS